MNEWKLWMVIFSYHIDFDSGMGEELYITKELAEARMREFDGKCWLHEAFPNAKGMYEASP